MTEAEWLACADPDPMLECPRLERRERKQRLFAVACYRRIVDLLTDESIAALQAAETVADGELGLHEILAISGSLETDTPDERRACAARAACATFESASWWVSMYASEGRATQPNTSIYSGDAGRAVKLAAQVFLLRDIFGNPFRPIVFDPSWRDETTHALARIAYETYSSGESRYRRATSGTDAWLI